MSLMNTRSFYRFLARFVDYCSPFWTLGAIFTIHDPNGAFTCRSLTLAILPDSGPFRGLLLTVLGYRREFHDLRPQQCVYVSFNNSHSFNRFWPVSWTITHRFGVSEGIPRLTTPTVRLRVVHEYSQF